MFWLGFIVGKIVVAICMISVLAICMRILGISWKDLKNLFKCCCVAIDNRDSKIEVYYEFTNEKIFEAEFKDPDNE